jgi:signal transduction histidine kinase
MLARLRIRQKLSLLLTIPLVAVVLVMVPFTAERFNDARSAGVTATTANSAREIGGLIQTLQQERLIALGYLSVAALDRSALLARSQESTDLIANLREDPATARAMSRAEPALSELDRVRRRLLDRRVDVATAFAAYRAADIALLDALNLGRPPGADAAGLSQLSALDALMRSNEEASIVGAVLVAAAADRSLIEVLGDAQTADKQHLRRFRELIEPGQADLIDAVERGRAGARIRLLAASMTRSAGVADPIEVTVALTAAVTYTDLRRLAQDRVAREIASAADDRARAASAIAWAVTGGALALFVAVVLLGITVSGSISRPLRRLTRAAGIVAEISGAELRRVADSDSPDPAPPQLAAVDIDSADEIGELAAALNRVQATAALLLERQVSTRRNVSVMFANIARRTQNLAGRQLALIDDLERNERSPELLQRLFRLDHIATRLRRSADSLLVVSGTIDQELSGTPTPLSDVMGSALTEIEGFRAVDVGDIAEVAVAASAVGDLRLLLAELIENATNFSPPGTQVQVSALLDDGDCEIGIVDHGVGLSAARMAEENLRLVERERLDVAPTTVLGLFVVGRLARRHGFSVRLEATAGRGVTALVRVPGRLLTAGGVPVGMSTSAVRVRPTRVVRGAIGGTIDAIEIPKPYGYFPWFMPRDEPAAIAASAGPMAARAADVSLAGAATASVAGSIIASMTPPEGPNRASVGSMSTRSADEGPAGPAGSVGPASSVSVAGTNGSPGSGLSRRIPGQYLVDAVREMAGDTRATRPLRPPRDAEAERVAVNDYLTGLSRGDGAMTEDQSHPSHVERPS